MSHIVTLKYDPVWEALHWAKIHCPSYITNSVHKEDHVAYINRIDYYFSDEKDAVIFALRWSDENCT